MTIPQVFDSIILDGHAKKWTEEDYITILRPLQDHGYTWNPETHTLRMAGPRGMTANTPWCHAKQSPDKFCGFDHQIMFNIWGMIPPRCLECWKVVVAPGSFKELMQLEQLEKQMNVPSKCGIELREYTSRPYGGYFYTNNFDKGRQRCFEVKEAIADLISPEMAEKTILKRGCTEFEMAKGPSPFWNISKEDLEFHSRIESLVHIPRNYSPQPEITKTNVRLRWMVHAHRIGDFSYIDWNNGKKLFPTPITYHEGDIDDIKHDLALARGEARGGIKPEISDKFLILCDDFVKEHKVSFNGLGHTLGANDANPLNLMKLNLHKDTPEELKGDQDELT